jgi:hypothetical protein
LSLVASPIHYKGVHGAQIFAIYRRSEFTFKIIKDRKRFEQRPSSQKA